MSATIRLRLALAQVDSTVGALCANARTVLERTRTAAAAGADLVAFPELHLTGYPPEDLVLRAGFRAGSQAAVGKLAADLEAEGLGEIAVVVGYVDDDAGPRNALAFIHRGQVVARYYKHHLPNYGVFDERRYFVPGNRFVAVRHRGVDLALTVCEDLWQDGGPFTVAGRVGVGLVVNINGSPYERNKDDVRLPLLQRRAAEARAPILYVNMVGGQDELVFDGDSMVVASDGRLLMRAPQYVDDLYLIDLDVAAAGDDRPAPEYVGMSVARYETTDQTPPAHPDEVVAECAAPLPDEAEVWGALVTGLCDYVEKNGFRSVIVATSGGIDSAVVAALAGDAVGGDRVYAVSLPSSYSSEHSKSDAADLAERIGAHYRTVPIAPMVDQFVGGLSLTGIAEENVQARVRGTVLMALSNAEGHLVLAPGNKSELAVGYSTIYGDAVGGFGPIKDVPKTLVWKLARWRNEEATRRGQTPPIPENSISKPPSAELRPGQLDSDSLPDYDVLDPILERYVDRDQSIREIVAAGFDADEVMRIAQLVDRAEWKRRQYPPGSKISYKNFGRDRRLPITNHWHEDSD
ncbi:MAG TPA: NAD+ synthase [Jatrophihabitantaceae bacterium]